MPTLAFKDIATTGTIGAGSNQLTVASAAGLTIGDSIIVAVGGEAGSGLRGSKGVGGTWPALSYATTVAMNADSGQAANTFAWVEASGDVYQYLSGVWTIRTPTGYYTCKAVPRALLTTITNIVGSVLTLADNATVATTNANVYFDNLPVFEAARVLNSDIDLTFTMAAGTFAISGRVFFQGNHRCILQGVSQDATIVFVPDGVFSANLNHVPGGIWAYQCDGMVFRDFHYKGNARPNGFGLYVTETSADAAAIFPYGVYIFGADGGEIRDVKVTQVFMDAFGAEFSTDVWAYNCTAFCITPHMQYTQWQIQWSDTTGGGCVDCTVDSDHLIAGFESFKGTGTQFIRPVGRNAVFSMNSSGSFLVEDCTLTIEADSQYSSASFSEFNPMFSLNTNTPGGVSDQGGTINNLVMIQEGYINANNDTLRGVSINADNPNITVNGGSYTAPDYAEPSQVYGPLGFGSGGLNTILSDFTVVGAPKSEVFPNIHVIGGGTSLIINCVAQLIIGPQVMRRVLRTITRSRRRDYVMRSSPWERFS